jgi:hypothetical protein
MQIPQSLYIIGDVGERCKNTPVPTMPLSPTPRWGIIAAWSVDLDAAEKKVSQHRTSSDIMPR